MEVTSVIQVLIVSHDVIFHISYSENEKSLFGTQSFLLRLQQSSAKCWYVKNYNILVSSP